MRKYNIKRDLAFHDGAYRAITQIMDMIDALICEGEHYRENEKLWRLRSKVNALEMLAKQRINENETKLNDIIKSDNHA